MDDCRAKEKCNEIIQEKNRVILYVSSKCKNNKINEKNHIIGRHKEM